MGREALSYVWRVVSVSADYGIHRTRHARIKGDTERLMN